MAYTADELNLVRLRTESNQSWDEMLTYLRQQRENFWFNRKRAGFDRDIALIQRLQEYEPRIQRAAQRIKDLRGTGPLFLQLNEHEQTLLRECKDGYDSLSDMVTFLDGELANPENNRTNLRVDRAFVKAFINYQKKYKVNIMDYLTKKD
jgi:hypothetical protein